MIIYVEIFPPRVGGGYAFEDQGCSMVRTAAIPPSGFPDMGIFNSILNGLQAFFDWGGVFFLSTDHCHDGLANVVPAFEGSVHGGVELAVSVHEEAGNFYEILFVEGFFGVKLSYGSHNPIGMLIFITIDAYEV